MTDGFPHDIGSTSDDELYVLLGAELDGAGLGISPADRERYQRFARTWLDNKRSQLWRKIHESETYRLWLDSAGPGQVVDPDTVDRVLGEQEGWDPRPAAVLALLLVREKCAEVVDSYDIAVSFAQEQRDYVHAIVVAAKALALKVFYEPDMTNAWWGLNFVQERRKVYGQRALHFVPFISAKYLTDGMPLDGFSAAMVRAIDRGDRYILPVLVGDVAVPPELLSPHIGVMRAGDHTPEELAAHMRVVVDHSRQRGMVARDFGAVVHDAQRELR